MRKPWLYIALFSIPFLFSCERLVMKPNAETTNRAIFEEYSKICIEKYGLAEVHNADLKALTDSLSPFINEELSDGELFDLLSLYVDRMKEGHTSLFSPDKSLSKAYYGWAEGYNPGYNFIVLSDYYYGVEANPDVVEISSEESFYTIQYGFLPQDSTIGYIRIPTFTMSGIDAEIAEMMNYLNDADGLIVDVRGNLGGYVELAAKIAGHFTSQSVSTGTNYIKNGPGEQDFAANEMILHPTGGAEVYTNPVIVIHDRASFSSGALFPIMMKSLNHVTTLGIPFGGGTGEIVDGFLSNGWVYTISTSNYVNLDNQPTDLGIAPDIPMEINQNDSTVDAMIERAILEL